MNQVSEYKCPVCERNSIVTNKKIVEDNLLEYTEECPIGHYYYSFQYGYYKEIIKLDNNNSKEWKYNINESGKELGQRMRERLDFIEYLKSRIIRNVTESHHKMPLTKKELKQILIKLGTISDQSLLETASKTNNSVKELLTILWS